MATTLQSILGFKFFNGGEIFQEFRMQSFDPKFFRNFFHQNDTYIIPNQIDSGRGRYEMSVHS